MRMRRFVILVGVAAGVAVVRQWRLARSERELGLGGDAGDAAEPDTLDVTA
jgi:hypothetical protein